MFSERIYNFSAGPSMLPLPVLQQIQQELLNCSGSGMSVMEMSHRSSAFDSIFQDTKSRLRALLQVPDDYEILFLQGGASTQFAMVPMNLMGRTGRADYALTGNFSTKAYEEAQKFGLCAVACSSADQNHTYIPQQEALQLDADASYFHYCANNTIYGTEWNYVPDTGAVPLVCDMSSNILSKPVDVSRYGLIYAGAQKNMAPAGVTVVILRRSLAGSAPENTPTMLNYATHVKGDSMYNTPPCWCIYVLGLVAKWLQEDVGGLSEMARRNEEKAALLYAYLDESHLFHAAVQKAYRSRMNVTFRTGDRDLDAQFAKEAAAAGLSNLKGHRLVGGMRASLYNAMPIEGVKALIDFMARFEKEHI
ncbi:3-phosphoserine/phosphohydroxythreonine transaminase [bacterium 210917-DFI.7.65]|nr:3-phosphoserine/phosphohydroxythreonine transaminase [Clostridiales bacterium]MCB6899356.1 3-phosphoserine/phosphohydroxythreonine transaminase [bacterium 210917-DFI.7.65]